MISESLPYTCSNQINIKCDSILKSFYFWEIYGRLLFLKGTPDIWNGAIGMYVICDKFMQGSFLAV